MSRTVTLIPGEGTVHDAGWDGFRSVKVALRKEFDLYANVRPTRSGTTESACRTWGGHASTDEFTDAVVRRLA